MARLVDWAGRLTAAREPVGGRRAARVGGLPPLPRSRRVPPSPALLLAVPLLAAGLGGLRGRLLTPTTSRTGRRTPSRSRSAPAPTSSCPDDLEAEVGAETRCTLTAGDDPTEYGVTVTVTSVEDDTANFDVEVDEHPSG